MKYKIDYCKANVYYKGHGTYEKNTYAITFDKGNICAIDTYMKAITDCLETLDNDIKAAKEAKQDYLRRLVKHNY
jgi:hypothetical protein